jgi:hypothetical protein
MANANKPGEITRDAAYTLDELNARLGVGKGALRQARRQGLTVRRIGRRSYVLGKDVIDWLERTAKVVG